VNADEGPPEQVASAPRSSTWLREDRARHRALARLVEELEVLGDAANAAQVRS
jgi:hypothetical protein